MNCKLCPLLAVVLVLTGCASGTRPPNAHSASAKAPGTSGSHPPPTATSPGLTEPTRTIHQGDMVRITLRFPDRTLGSLEAVQKNGDVATPEGSFVKADGISLLGFRTNLAAMYATITGYEGVNIDASIASSPYRVIKYSPNHPLPARYSSSTSTNAPASVSTNLPPATVLPRIFTAPLTLWEAIGLEGGVPQGVNPAKIHVLKKNLGRKAFDCSGPGGRPDGGAPVENGDSIFLVPEGTPLSSIFE